LDFGNKRRNMHNHKIGTFKLNTA